MWRAFSSAARFAWTATTGNRLRPWRSEYLRWRLETYSGKPAKSLAAADFFRLAVGERKQVTRFVRWMGEMRGLAEDGQS